MKRDAIRRGVIQRSFHGIQPLEARRLLAAVSWDGGAGTLAWTDAANWSNDVLPTAADDVTIDVPAAITVTLSSGTQTINSLTSAEGLTLSGTGVLEVAEASSVSGAFTLNSGTAGLAGAGTVTLNGAASWTAGTMAPGGTTIIANTLGLTAGTNLPLQRNLTINPGAAMNWSGAGDLLMSNAVFTNHGTINHTNTGTTIFANTAGTNAVVNHGAFIKNPTGNLQINVPLTNSTSGTFTVSAGTITVGGELTNDGAMTFNTSTVNINASSTYGAGSSLQGDGVFNFNAGTHVFASGRYTAVGTTGVFGAANVTINDSVALLNPTISGTATFNAPISMANATLSGNVTFNQTAGFSAAVNASGTVAFNGIASFGSTLTVGGTTTFNSTGTFGGIVTVGGRMNVNTGNPGLSIPTVTVNSGGVIGGSGLLVITNTLNSGGNTGMVGTGTTRLATGATLPNVGNAWGINDGYTFHNQGTVTMGGDNPDIYLGGGTFINDGVLQSVNGTGQDQIVNNPGTNLFINNGTIRKNVGSAGSVLYMEVRFEHNGRIEVGPGQIAFSGPTSNFNPGSTTSGTGNILFNGGTLNVLDPNTLTGIGNDGGSPVFNGGTAVFNLDTTIVNGRFGGSTIEGSAMLSLGNGTQVYNGTFSATGGGRVRVAAGASAELTGNNPVFARPFDIFGTFRMSSGGDLNVRDTIVTVESTGTLHFNTGAGGSDVEYASGATSGVLVNKGTVLRDSTGSALITVRFDNQGLVDVNGGGLGVYGGFADGTYTRTTGIYDVNNGTLTFPSAVNTNGAEMIARAGASINGLTNLQYNDGKLDLRDGIDWHFDPFASQGNTLHNRGQIELSPGSVMTIANGNNLFFSGTGNATIRSEIAGPTVEEYGRLVVGGQLRLASPDGGDSQFDPDLVGGYDPATGTRFNVITAVSIVEAFDNYFGATTPSGNILLAGKSASEIYAEVGTGTPPPAPQILSSNYEFQTRQAITLGFNVDVSAFISRKDLTLVNLTTNTTVNRDIGQLVYDAVAKSATLTLTNLLADGNYRLTIAADDIANAAGQTLVSPLTLDFFVLAGDANQDRKVDFDDLLTLAQNYGQNGRTFSQGNFNYTANGAVNFDDLLLLAQRYGVSLPGVVAIEPAAAKTAATAKKRESSIGTSIFNG